MKASEFIENLRQLIEKHGDKQVFCYDHSQSDLIEIDVIYHGCISNIFIVE
jgi:hypothetical protein